MEFGVLEELARKGHLVVAVEPRGTGLTTPQHFREPPASWEFRQLFDVETAAAYMAWFMDESLLGMRVLDVLRGVDYALGRDDVDKRGLRAVGSGKGATWLLFAAALDAAYSGPGLRPRTAVLQEPHRRRTATSMAPTFSFRAYCVSSTCHRSRRPLRTVHWLYCLRSMPMKRTVGDPEAGRAYDWTRKAYAGAQAGGRFNIRQRAPELPLAEQYLRALDSQS